MQGTTTSKRLNCKVTLQMCGNDDHHSCDLITANAAVTMRSSTLITSDHMLVGHGTGHMHAVELCVTHMAAAGI